MPLIKVENEVNLIGPPETFKYHNHSIPADDVIVPNDPVVGCSCTGTCNTNDCADIHFGAKCAYGANKRYLNKFHIHMYLVSQISYKGSFN